MGRLVVTTEVKASRVPHSPDNCAPLIGSCSLCLIRNLCAFGAEVGILGGTGTTYYFHEDRLEQ